MLKYSRQLLKFLKKHGFTFLYDKVEGSKVVSEVWSKNAILIEINHLYKTVRVDSDAVTKVNLTSLKQLRVLGDLLKSEDDSE